MDQTSATPFDDLVDAVEKPIEYPPASTRWICMVNSISVHRAIRCSKYDAILGGIDPGTFCDRLFFLPYFSTSLHDLCFAGLGPPICVDSRKNLRNIQVPKA